MTPPAPPRPSAPAPCPACGAGAVPGARFCPACGAPLPAAGATAVHAPDAHPADALGARVAEALGGGYAVLGEVGRGGMAVVYLAWDRGLARHAAIKVLRPALSEDPAMARRFLQEGRTAAGLDAHPGVVRVYAAHEAAGLRYLAMQYVDGCSLEALLRARGPLPPDLAAFVVEQVAGALHYAHARGVVHRDVKPANVLLARDGQVAVADFGIAKAAAGGADAARAAGDTLGRTGAGLGTPAYMSPEHWRDEPFTPAADQYALGVLAYQLVAGRVPFGGSLYATQQGHLHEPPPPLAGPGAGPALAAYAAVAARALAKRPADRYPSLGAMAAALARVPHDEPAVLRVRLARLVRAVAADPGAIGAPAAAPPAADPPAADPAVVEAGTVRIPRAPSPEPAPAAAVPAAAAVVGPVDAHPIDPGRAERAADADGMGAAADGVPPERAAAPRRRRGVHPLLGVATVAVLAAAGWAAWPRPAAPPAAPSGTTPPATATSGTATPGTAAPSAPGIGAPAPSPPTAATPTPTPPSAAPVSPSGRDRPPATSVPDAGAAGGTTAPVRRRAAGAANAPTGTAARRVAAARPADADVQQAVRQLAAAVTARDVRALGRRLAPRAGDGTAARDFLVWLRSADRLALRAPATRGAVAVRGQTARVAVRLPLRWRARLGPARWMVRRDAVFWLTLAPEGARWRPRTLTLAGRFPP